MEAAAADSVRIGDQTYTVGRLSAFKVLRAGTLLTGILREVPELTERMAEFQRDYAKDNTIEVSRAYAELRYDPEDLAKVSDQAWAESGGKLVIPATPGPLDVAAHLVPYAWDAAQDRVLELLALLVTPNSELRASADDEDGIRNLLRERSSTLIHEDAAELLELLAVAAEVIEQQFAGKAAALRKVAALFGFQTTSEEGTTTSTPSPPTSTDSAAPTTGVETNGSGSPSEPSSVSSSG